MGRSNLCTLVSSGGQLFEVSFYLHHARRLSSWSRRSDWRLSNQGSEARAGVLPCCQCLPVSSLSRGTRQGEGKTQPANGNTGHPSSRAVSRLLWNAARSTAEGGRPVCGCGRRGEEAASRCRCLGDIRLPGWQRTHVSHPATIDVDRARFTSHHTHPALQELPHFVRTSSSSSLPRS